MATSWDTSDGASAGEAAHRNIKPEVARIVDANANRAREAMRVIEDYVRFALNDRELAARAKALRHDFAAVMNSPACVEWVRSRDITGDVGTTIAAESEYDRSDAMHVAAAAAKRCTEALRSIEEFVKTFDARRAGTVEAIRYRAYEIERAVVIRGGAERFGRVELYVLITEALCTRDWLKTARDAIEGGADCIQIREKHLPDRELLDRTRRLAEACRGGGALLIVNDRPDVAMLGGADGVHIGQDDMTLAQARRIAGPSMIVGVSTHTIDQARAAMLDSPDYIAAGPMFAGSTKPQQHVPGPQLISAVQAETSLPVVPIGGITPGAVGELIAAGARRICVCAAVISQTDVTGAARRLKELLQTRPAAT